MRNLGKVIHYAKVQLRFQHSQVGARPSWEGRSWGPRCPPTPSPQTLALLSRRTSVTATWNCSPPTSISRPMVLKGSLSR